MAKKFETAEKGTFDNIVNNFKGASEKRSGVISKTQPEPKSKKASPGRPKKKITRDQTHNRTTLYIRKDLSDFFDNYLEGTPDKNFSQLINDLLDKEKSRIEKKK